MTKLTVDWLRMVSEKVAVDTMVAFAPEGDTLTRAEAYRLLLAGVRLTLASRDVEVMQRALREDARAWLKTAQEAPHPDNRDDI